MSGPMCTDGRWTRPFVRFAPPDHSHPCTIDRDARPGPLPRCPLEPLLLELLASLPPLLGGDGVADVVLPDAVDLEEAHSDAFLPEPQLGDHPPAGCVAGDDRDLDAVQPELLEAEAQDDRGGLGCVPLPGHCLVDPIPDEPVLERSPLDSGQVHLAGETVSDEHAEAVPAAHLALPLTGPTP